MRAFVIPFPCIHQKILPILFYHEPSVMRNGQLVTEVLKFAVSERKKREPHTRFSFVCAIPALCFLISRFSGWNSPEFVLPGRLPGSYSSCGRTSESINSQISSLPCLVSAENGMIIVPGCTPSPSRIALTFF